MILPNQESVLPYMLAMLFVFAIGQIFTMVWLWRDARNLGINPWPWVLIVGLISPNFLGLAVYAIVRQQHIKVISTDLCTNCNARIPSGANFCPSCGVVHKPVRSQIRTAVSKTPLVIGIIIIVLAFAGLICGGFFFGDCNGTVA